MASVAKACGNMFQLLQGFSAETSGGLLIALPREQAAAYCKVSNEKIYKFSVDIFQFGCIHILKFVILSFRVKDIEKQEGYQSWIVGIVEKGQRTARIIDKPRVIEVPGKEKDEELW